MQECTVTGGGHLNVFDGCLDAPDMLASGGTDDGMTVPMVFRDAEDYDKWLNDDSAMLNLSHRPDFATKWPRKVH